MLRLNIGPCVLHIVVVIYLFASYRCSTLPLADFRAAIREDVQFQPDPLEINGYDYSYQKSLVAPRSFYRIISHAPNVFKSCTRIHRIDVKQLISSLCDHAWVEKPGAKNQFFFSYDGSYIITSITDAEYKYFMNTLLRRYHLEIKDNRNSILVQYVGLYSYEETRLIIIRNLAFNSGFDQIFEIKGSKIHRRVTGHEAKWKYPTFKDLDFERMHKNGLQINRELYIVLANAVRANCFMLKAGGSTDYSLALAIRYVKDGEPFNDALIFESGKIMVPRNGIPGYDGKGARVFIYVGIVDILTYFDVLKKAWSGLQVFRYGLHKNQKISVINADDFAKRFFDFVVGKVFHPNPSLPNNWVPQFSMATTSDVESMSTPEQGQQGQDALLANYYSHSAEINKPERVIAGTKSLIDVQQLSHTISGASEWQRQGP